VRRLPESGARCVAGEAGGGDHLLAGIMASRVMGGLETVLNYLLLNAALVLTALPVLTLPMSVAAATTALERWRQGGEDRVLKEFALALRAQVRAGTIVAVGVPFVAIGVGVEEIHYFGTNSMGIVGQVCLGLGVFGVLMALTALGYVLVLSTRYPLAGPSEVLRLAVQLGVRNLFVTGPLFIGEIGVAVALCLVDPALVLVGVPVALVNVIRVTAELGIRRSGVPEWKGPG